MANVLVVDDDSHFRDIITRVILRSYTYSVATAATEAEAWDHLSRDVYDLVLLDLYVDGRKSWETLKRIGRLSARPSVIVVSCEDTKENAAFAKSLGAVDFLPKPIHFGRLKMSIDGALGWKSSLARAWRESIGPGESGGVEEMRILIVGDKGNRQSVNSALTKTGFDRIEVEDGDGALEIVRKERIDAVLARIDEGGGNAAGAIKAIRESEGGSLRLPVIAVTESDQAAILAALRAGADDFVSIPVDPPILAGKVEAHVRLRREYDRRLEQVVSLCVRDALTGSYNHAYFKARLHEEFGRCLRYKRSLTLALLGLENLRKVTSAFGASAGERILAEASRAIQDSIRSSDVLARCSEDEFALIMPEATADRVVKKAGVLRARVEERVAFLDGKKTEVACAVGLASFPLLIPAAAPGGGKPAQAPSAEDLLGVATMALTRARVSGSGRVEVFGG